VTIRTILNFKRVIEIVILPRSDEIMIIPYSLKKIKTNKILLISMLNPLISSLSPSNRSKGARLVSIHIRNTHKIIQTNETSSLNLSLQRLSLW